MYNLFPKIVINIKNVIDKDFLSGGESYFMNEIKIYHKIRSNFSCFNILFMTIIIHIAQPLVRRFR